MMNVTNKDKAEGKGQRPTGHHKTASDQYDNRCLVVKAVYVVVDHTWTWFQELFETSEQLKHGCDGLLAQTSLDL